MTAPWIRSPKEALAHMAELPDGVERYRDLLRHGSMKLGFTRRGGTTLRGRIGGTNRTS